jgi:hypothetical protein
MTVLPCQKRQVLYKNQAISAAFLYRPAGWPQTLVAFAAGSIIDFRDLYLFLNRDVAGDQPAVLRCWN